MRDVFLGTFLDSAVAFNKIGQSCGQTMAYPSIAERIGVPRPQLYIDAVCDLY